MDTYKSNEETVYCNIDTVYAKLSNPECFRTLIENENIPADMKQRMGGVEFTSDSIAFNADPVGKVVLQIVERTQPTKIAMAATSFPLPFRAEINLEKVADNETKLFVEFKIELNIMLRAMAAKPLGDGVKKMAQMLAMLPYDRL